MPGHGRPPNGTAAHSDFLRPTEAGPAYWRALAKAARKRGDNDLAEAYDELAVGASEQLVERLLSDIAVAQREQQ